MAKEYMATEETHQRIADALERLAAKNSGKGGGLSTSKVFTGASDSVGGSAGLVPAPIAGEEDYFLKGNGSWSVLPENSNGSTTNYKQMTEMDVRASTSSPYEVSIQLSKSTEFQYAPPNVLLCTPDSSTTVAKTIYDFNNEDAADFVFDDKYVIFDGTMRLRTEYNIDMGEGTILGNGKLFISETVNLSDYKKAESVEANNGTVVGIAAPSDGSGTWERITEDGTTIIISSAGVAYDFAGNQLTTNWASLTDADKIAVISNAVYGDPITTMETLGTFSFATYTVKSGTPFCTLTAVPKDQLITPNSLISLEGSGTINSVTVTANVNGNASLRLAVTDNKETYYVYDSSEFYWDYYDATTEDILEYGMTASGIATLSTYVWKEFIEEETENSNEIGFAYALSMTDTTDTLSVDAMIWNMNIWRGAIHGDEYTYGYPDNHSMRFLLYKSGNWKINYDTGKEERSI